MLGLYHDVQKVSPGAICGVEEKNGEEHRKEDNRTPFRQRRRVYDPFLQLESLKNS